MQGPDKKVVFKAVQKEEMKMYAVFPPLRDSALNDIFSRKKEMGGEENMVLTQIQAAGNEGESLISHSGAICISLYTCTGIWTKHLKGKTELHQTIITRCLKALEGKQLIKSVKSVKVSRYPTFPGVHLPHSLPHFH